MIRQPGFVFVVGGFVVFGVGAGLLAAGAGPGASAASDRPRLSVTGAYLPQPASQEVPAYVTVRNSGTAADRLIGVRTDVSSIVMLHRGSGAQMELVSSVPLPPHRQVQLAGGGLHLMVMDPTRVLLKGDWVRFTLVFARSEPVKVSVPVVGPNSGPPAGQGGHGHG
jgi:periplasmic copper chaperone A